MNDAVSAKWADEVFRFLRSPLTATAHECAVLSTELPHGADLWSAAKLLADLGVFIDPNNPYAACPGSDRILTTVGQTDAPRIGDTVAQIVKRLIRIANTTAAVEATEAVNPPRVERAESWLLRVRDLLVSPARAASREAVRLELSTPREPAVARYARSVVFNELGLGALAEQGWSPEQLAARAGRVVEERVLVAANALKPMLSGLVADVARTVRAALLAGENRPDDPYVVHEQFTDVRQSDLIGVGLAWVGLLPDPLPPDHLLRGVTPLRGPGATFVLLGADAGSMQFIPRSRIEQLTAREHERRASAIAARQREIQEREDRLRREVAGTPDEMLRQFLEMKNKIARLEAAVAQH